MAKKAAQRVRIELEYPLRSSKAILYSYLSNPSGLQSWYAEHVDVKGNKYTFKWDDGTVQEAELVKSVLNKTVQFNITNAPTEGEVLHFTISEDSITGDIELVIVDYANVGEEENQAAIWDSSVDYLRQIIGA